MVQQPDPTLLAGDADRTPLVETIATAFPTWVTLDEWRVGRLNSNQDRN